MPSHDILRKQGAFFGRRKGHKLRSHQADLVETLLPRLQLDLAEPAPGRLGALFPASPDGVRLEIGFGGGEHLLAEADAFPQTGFIGCEPYVNGMAKLLARIESRPADNIRLFAGDAAELIGWLHEAADAGSPVVLNAGAWTHTSVAVRDAAAQLTAPLVEVHLSNVHAREEFRHHSYLSDIATAVVVGMGIEGYAAALRFLATR